MMPLEPMLLGTLRAWPPQASVSLLECKHDGIRVVSMVARDRVRCWTRHGTDISTKLTAVRAELAMYLPNDSIVDGELVALDRGPDGQVGEDFNLLFQSLFGRHPHPLSLLVFDVPRLAGEQLTDRPWQERRVILDRALRGIGPSVAVTDVFDADPDIHARLVQLGFEGSVIKRRDGRYLPGRRSAAWRKLKTRSESAAIIEVVVRDRGSGVVEHVGCRALDDPARLTWAVVWSRSLRRALTPHPERVIGRRALLAYTHRTINGALREARLVAVDAATRV